MPVKQIKAILLLILLPFLVQSQSPCDLGNYTSAYAIKTTDFPYTSPGSGITVTAAAPGVPTLGNISYNCGPNTFATATPSWWLNAAGQVITLTFSAPVSSITVVFNGTGASEEFYFNSNNGGVSVTGFCTDGWSTINSCSDLIFTGGSSSGNIATLNVPGGATEFYLSHNGLEAGSRISLLDCFVPATAGGGGGPVINPITDISVCSGESVPASNFTSTPSGSTFNWTNSNTGIGLAASGAGNTPAFVATNSTSTPITSTITVTSPPSGSGCGTVTSSPVTYTITVNPPPTFTITSTDPSCGNSDGGIVIAPGSGSTITEYSIDGGTTTQPGGTFPNLGAGSYTIYIKDNNGCETTGTVPVELVNSGSTTDPSFTLTDFCEGTTNLATGIATSGGTFSIISPLGDGATIDASTGAITNGVGGTTYTIEYETGGACSASTTEDVTVNASPTYTVATTNPSCGATDGVIVISPGTGFTITDYSIDNGITKQTGGTFSNLGAGSYTVYVKDNNGCEATGPASLNVSGSPTITNVSSTDASCIANDGTITVSASGGTGTLSYNLNTGQTSSNGIFTGLPNGNYVVTVKDANGCIVTQSVTVGKASNPTLTIVNSNDVSCFGESDGSATVNATGGTASYTYNWMPTGGSAATAAGLAPGTYTVSVVDGSGCTNQVQITIAEPSGIIINKVITPSDCGQDNGAIALTVTGGTGNYTYAWDPNVSSTNQATDLAIGSYEVTVTDDNGCTKTASYTVPLGNSFYIEAIPESATILQGASVSTHLFIDPNITVDNILWTPASGLSCTDCKDPIASPDYTTTYIVTVTDENGCKSTDTVKINVILPCADVFVPNTFSPNADGLNDLQCVIGECIVSLDFIIFNRWGEAIFHSIDQKECWDGTFRGKPVQSGVYIYKLKATLENGQKIEQSGNVTLVR